MTQPGADHAGQFINRLLRLGEERAGPQIASHRASLAELRRGLGRTPGEAPGAYREVLAILDDTAASTRFEDVCFQVATLYALYPRNGGTPRSVEQGRRRNLGSSLRLLGGRDERRQGAERRVLALLNCNADDLPDHLRHAVSLLRADDQPIDWRQLLTDLRGWSQQDRHVQRAWARAFWGYSANDESAMGSVTETNTTESDPATVAPED